MHELNCFITLTYSDEHLPADGGLVVSDWQRFAKRLRKKNAFRFFHCGEYGDENLRPHYHACMFGIDFSGDRFLFKDGKHPLYRSPLLEETWGLGHCTVGALSFESAAYVARYCMKKATGDKATRYERIDADGVLYSVKPEYATMSRRPGLGASWFEKYFSDVFPSDEVVHEGRRFRPPPFYTDKLQPNELERVKRKRLDAVFDRAGDLTPERLKVRELCAELRFIPRS